MKNIKKLVWFSPLTLLIAGCAGPVHQDATISEWQREGMLPPNGRGETIAQFERGGRLLPTGSETENVYTEPTRAPLTGEPKIVVESDQDQRRASDLALAEIIRLHMDADRGLAPSLGRVVISVRDGRVTLQGTVKSDLDARITADNVREVAGVTEVDNNLGINPNWD
jgi:hypothetical protein